MLEGELMALPNKTGGPVHCERTQASPYNEDGTSRALYANQPNEKDWVPVGEIYDEEPRQCAAGDRHLASDETGSPPRCRRVAYPGKMTCRAHGGTFQLSPQHKAKAHAASVKTGLSVKTLMYCPCKPHGEHCPDKGMYTNEQGIQQCGPERQMYDSVTSYFMSYYDLDDAADLIMLDRLAMNLIRIRRAERLVAEQGEITERVRTSGDGSVERWFEPNAAGRVADQVDKRVQAWLKELAITKAARDGRKVTVSGTIDLATLLTGARPNMDDEDEVIEL